jgi:hypothetical protein
MLTGWGKVADCGSAVKKAYFVGSLVNQTIYPLDFGFLNHYNILN